MYMFNNTNKEFAVTKKWHFGSQYLPNKKKKMLW